MKKNEISANDFRKAIETGVLSVENGKIKTNNLEPEYKEHLKQTKLFDDKELIDVSKLDEKQKKEVQKELNEDMLKHLRLLHSQNKAIFLPFNTPSLKNSKKIVQMNTKLSVCHKKELKKGSDNVWYCSQCDKPAQRLTRPSLISSDLVQEYEKNINPVLASNKAKWDSIVSETSFPLIVGFYFIRDSRRSFDFVNSCQVVLDLMVNNCYMPDDSMIYIVPDFLGYHIDQERPGAIICLMDKELITLKYKNL